MVQLVCLSLPAADLAAGLAAPAAGEAPDAGEALPDPPVVGAPGVGAPAPALAPSLPGKVTVARSPLVFFSNRRISVKDCQL
ncbi:hypothetical protein BATDEDRAFT_31309, partial [Batrachochytrium dendrobatidis JAM81]